MKMELIKTTIIALFLVTTIHAAIKSDTNDKLLPKNVTAEQAQALMNGTLKARELKIADRREANKQVVEAIQSVTEDARKALRTVADKDKVLGDQVKKYAAEVQQLAKLSGKQQRELASKMKDKYRPLFKEMFKKAGINEIEYRKKSEQQVYKIAKSNKYFLGKHPKFIWSEYLTLYLEWLDDVPTSKPVQAVKEITLAPPFPNVQQEGDGTANKEEGVYDSYASAGIAGGEHSISGLGHFVELPSGFSRVRMTAALPDTSTYLSAFADLLGAAGSSATSTIEVFFDNEIVCEEHFDHGSLIAIVLWIASESATHTYTITCNFDAPRDPTEMVVSFYGETDAWAGGLAYSSASVTAKPRDIKLRLTN